MDFLIQVRWSNGGSALLQGTSGGDPTVEVRADSGSALTPTAKTAGGRDFLVKSPSSKVSVLVDFEPTIRGFTRDLLFAGQHYTVAGDTLSEADSVTMGRPGKPFTVPKHPLITTTKVSAASTAARSVYTVNVNTDFVDVTALFRDQMKLTTTCKAEAFSCLDAYDKLHEPGTDLVVLASTGASPLFWFVLVPTRCASVSKVSSLVFFRPASSGFANIQQLNGEHMYGLNRYLLRPRSPDPGVWWAWDRYHNISDDQFATVKDSGASQTYDWLCAGFEHAVDKCGKDVILVYPWPSGTGFGEAQGPKLLTHLATIRALLHTLGFLGNGQSAVTEKKLALASYSAGGPGMWACFDANKARVQEIYTFDPNDGGGRGPSLAQWAFATSDFRLRLVTGKEEFVTKNEAIAKTVNDKLSTTPRTASGGEVTVHPSSPSTFYQPSSAGGHKWWNYAFGGFSNINNPRDSYTLGTRHQFAIYGGEDPSFAGATTPSTPWNGVTFLEQFLRNSTL